MRYLSIIRESCVSAKSKHYTLHLASAGTSIFIHKSIWHPSIKSKVIFNAIRKLATHSAGKWDQIVVDYKGQWDTEYKSVCFTCQLTDEHAQIMENFMELETYQSFCAYVRKKEKIKGRDIPEIELLNKYIDEYQLVTKMDNAIGD